ncbi:hypothetical protein PCA31118_04848 [Pandoraea captiosa]|uniref:Uncharacterized protein n=1 Tax=Pandoraea captiosa TaxID=2508302 RepID=A0A5E5AM44_9BURK|nr:hypothetical protein PCA31118_04848 [Pandoraea captiosa]
MRSVHKPKEIRNENRHSRRDACRRIPCRGYARNGEEAGRVRTSGRDRTRRRRRRERTRRRLRSCGRHARQRCRCTWRRTRTQGTRPVCRRTRSDPTWQRSGRHAQSVRCRKQRAHGGGRCHRLRAGSRTAHHARAEYGRALLAGQHRRLQGRDARGEPLSTLHADAHDRRRYGQGRTTGRARCGRGRPSGHCDGQAPGGGHRSLRRASGRARADRIAGREVHRRALRDGRRA